MVEKKEFLIENILIGQYICPAGIVSCEIDTNGDVYPCSYLNCDELIIGNILDSDFQEQWLMNPRQLMSMQDKKSQDKIKKFINVLSEKEVVIQLLNGILSDGSRVKLNLAITGGIQYQWQGLRRHECPIDIAFACD